MSETADLIAREFADYDDDQLRELHERVAQIGEMTQHPGWGLYKDLVLAKTTARQRVILAGRLSPEDYNRETGWVAGAIAALDAPADLALKLELRVQLEEETSPNEGANDA